jgi:hypothetical protein
MSESLTARIFWFQDHQLLIARPDDGNHAVAGALEGCGRGISHHSANAAAHNYDGAIVRNLRGLTQRANHVEDLIASFQ